MKNATTDTEHDFVPPTSRWQRRAQPRKRYQNTPLLAVGMASALAILVPLKADAMQTVKKEVNLVNEYLDMNGDRIPDLSCVAGEDTLDWTNSKYLYCRGIGGARIWGDADNCLPVTNAVRIDTLSEKGWKAVCQLDSVRDENELSETGPVTKVLGMKTSGGGYGWIEVVINQAHNQVKAVAWAYEPDVKQPVVPPACGETYCSSTTPPSPEPAVLDKDKISWVDKFTNEIGFNVYCDDKFLAQVDANVTHYYFGNNLEGGMPHRCEIKAVLPDRSESLAAAVSAYIPMDERPPLSWLLLKLEPSGPGSSCTGGVTATVDGRFIARCDSTDCQTLRDSQGKPMRDSQGHPVQNCAPNCSLALQRDDFGKEVTLKPRADPGCEFSSWGVNTDCTDGKTLVTTDNKECLPYFRLRSTSRHGERIAVTTGQSPQAGSMWVRGSWSAPNAPFKFPLPNGIGLDWDGDLNSLGMFQNYAVPDCDCYPVMAPSSSDPESVIIPTNTCREATANLTHGGNVYTVFIEDIENVVNTQVFCRWNERNVIYLPDSQE